MNVMIVVTHLLGTGHLARALTLAHAVQAAGDTVCVVSGGMPAPHLNQAGIEVVQLPPLRSDGVNFSRLLDAEGLPVTEAMLAERDAQLRGLLGARHWDVIITELFPFGRRILRHEFLSLLEAAHTLPRRPLICASIRDILAPPSKPEKAIKTDAILERLYDAVLVHADPDLTPLETSWPVSDMLRSKLHYTGFVAPPPALPHPEKIGEDEIIVTAGGGDVGGPIFAAALSVARTSNRKWRVLLGGADAASRAAAMAQNAPENITIEPARPDFRQLLHHAAACVCMCGYNTALDVLQTGCPAVFIPFDEGSELEQTLRAKALEALDGIRMVTSRSLTPQTLADAIDGVTTDPRRGRQRGGMDGAAETARILRTLVEARV